MCGQLAAGAAKIIEQKRMQLESQAKVRVPLLYSTCPKGLRS